MEIFSEKIPVAEYPIPVARRQETAYLWQMGIEAGTVRVEGGEIRWA